MPTKASVFFMGVCCSYSCTKPTVNPLFPKKPCNAATYDCSSEHQYEREGRKTDIHLREVCYIKMANTISNIKMTNAIKNLVSKQRRRYIQDGYNLDLTYIRDNLIAMGFPAEKLEGVYRNHIDDVVKFLESKHKDHYKIYNLCSERSYDVNRFHGRVSTYAFNDHNPPRLELIQPFCQDVDEWLSQDHLNVAAVHCKAGKGRTGVMISCYMLHSKQFQSADDALSFYGQMRTHDRKGVTIPSQRRYVGYYAELLREGWVYEPACISIREIRLEPLPVVSEQSSVQVVISDLHSRIYVSPVMELKRLCRFHIEGELRLKGDIKVELFHKPKMKRSEKMFHYWINTFFVRDCAAPDAFSNGTEVADRSGRALSCDATGRPPATRSTRANSLTGASIHPHSVQPLVLHLRKHEIDNAHKDKQHKIFTEDFRVSMFFHKVPDCYTDTTPRPSVQSPSQTTPSESSEADSTDCSTGEEDGWDSGETTYL